MKSSKKALALALAAAMVVTAIPATNANAATTGLSAKKATVYVGGSKTLTVKTPKSWKSVKVTASTSNKKVAKVKKISNKKVKVTAVKAGTAKVKVKVTYKKSTKKNAKKYTKTYTCKTTVKNPTLAVSVKSKKLVIGDKMAIKTKKTPSSAKVTYSTNDPSIASVYDGTITANGVGPATITAKMTYGKKVIKKTIKITVVAGLEDGITPTLTNPVNAEYPNATLLAADGTGTATYRVYYGKNGKGVADSTLAINYTIDTVNGKKSFNDSVVTDANGLATFSIYNDGYGVANANFTITVVATGEKKTGTVAFAEVRTDSVINVNGMKDGVKDLDGVVTRKGTDYVKLGYSALKVSENDYSGTGASAKPGEGKDWTAGTFTTKRVNATTSSAVASYWTQYVDSQQVSTNTEHQVGFVGGLPYITLPGNSADLNAATKFTQNVGLTSNEYHTYANDSQYIELSVNPSELTYATLNFSSLKLSDKTRLVIETYKSKAAAEKSDTKERVGVPTTVDGPHDQSNFSYQIPLRTGGNGLCIKVTLQAAGQVNTDMNKGYTISDITGVYKNQTKASGQTTVLMKGAEIKWSTTNAKYSEEKTIDKNSSLMSGLKRIAGNNVDLDGEKVNKVTYRVPVFPYTGNAVITTYDKNNKVLAYYACPTENNENTKTNTNTLDLSGYAQYVYQISQEEAFNNVGEITSQTNDLVTVNSKLAGTTTLVGTITGVKGLDATNSTVYTSVQWNPVNASTKAADHSGAIAFAGQNVDLIAQLVDQNGNAVSTSNQDITFKYGDKEKTFVQGNSISYDNSNVVTGGPVAVVKVDSKTDTKGQAKLTLNAAKITTLVGVTASTPNKSYKVVLSVAGQNVEKADVYWIEAKPQFTPSVNEKPETGKKVTGKCTPEAGSNWEYGFTLQDETLVGGVFDGWTATISDANIALSVVKNADKTSNVATVNTNTGKNGMATATSTKSGYTTFEATVDGSAVAGKTVNFTVKKGNDTKGTFTSVGTGKTAFTNKQDLEVNWTTKGLTAAFDTANGTTATTSGAFDLYFRVADTYGNKGKDQTVDVTSDMKSVLGLTGAPGSNSSKDDVYTAKTDAHGLVKISVPSTGKKAGDREIITATVDNVAYTTIITWTDAATATIDTTRDENNHYYTNWDGNTITLTFDQDILASSVDASQFTATYGTDTYAIESATVNGNVITLKIKNGPASTSIDKTYSVAISSINNNGVVVSVKTVNGASVPTSVLTINNIAK